MVNLSWVTNLFSSDKYKAENNDYKSDLDHSMDGLNNLIKLTQRLDEVERTVRNNEEFLGFVTDSLRISIWVKDVNSRFLYLNKECAETILKTTVKGAMNLKDEDFKRDALARVCMKSDQKVLSRKTSLRFIEHARYDDHDLWIDVIKSPLFIKEKVVGVVGAAKNITSVIPMGVLDRFSESDALEIDLNLHYCIGVENERRKDSLVALLEKNKESTFK